MTEVEKYIDELKCGRFKEWTVDDVIAAFTAGKNSMPVVVLPDTDHYYLEDSVYDCDEIHAALDAAGIKYVIKG